VPPKPGDLLTIHGYGQGQYRIATGHCTQFFAPKENFPCEMVELDVEARQGDSGGPIFNDRGEIAGVLFGAGEGTTIGSFAPRVQSFLTSLAPDIGQAKDQAQIAIADRPAPDVHLRPVNPDATPAANEANEPSSDELFAKQSSWPSTPWSPARLAATSNAASSSRAPTSASSSAAQRLSSSDQFSWHDVAGSRWFDGAKSALAVVGMIAVALQLMRVVK
jgi:hypothetical protein